MEEGKEMAEKFGCRFLETSAKTGEGVKELFEDLGIEICEKLN